MVKNSTPNEFTRIVALVKKWFRNTPKNNASLWDSVIREKTASWSASADSRDLAPRVLIATSMGGYQQGALLESVLAVALTLRGAKVEILLCDEFLPACQLTKIGGNPVEQFLNSPKQARCGKCFAYGKELFSPLGLPVHRFSSFVTYEQSLEVKKIAAEISIDDIDNYQWNGLAIGEHAKAGALRYYASGNLSSEPHAGPVLRRYLESALLTAMVTSNLLEKKTYDVVCFNHGIYVPQGIIGEVCRQKNVAVVNWNPSYRKSTFIFSHGDSYHHTMITEPVEVWENINLTESVEKKTMDYLKSRWHGTEDWIWFHERPESSLNKIASEIGVDFSRPVIGLLTNVMWDAQLHYRSNAFKDMLDWVVQTINYFADRPDLQLLIRVHPAEIRGVVPSRQPIVREIQKLFPQLPSNIFVIPPESQVSTYAAMQECDSVLIYNTKTGIEISSLGIPVIVAGEAWIRNKGFSLDATSPAEYFQILDRLPLKKRMDEVALERARKYAYHFFFRRMIQLSFFEEQLKVSIQSMEELLPGRSKGLDIICEGILNGAPFIYPDELDVQ
ncbi:MAG: hypothetical protein KJZ72_00550 [Anaerolineales bacterium]|nr:hypothetical protein [Anaerolineales bacterium]